MSFRKEEKLRVASGKIFTLRKWINENQGITIYPTRIVNSIYFDNYEHSMYNHSVEGVTPRKKIRIRTYNKKFDFNQTTKINKEIKITATEGRFKISEIVNDPLKLINFGIYDNNYGLCIPVLNISYQRSYYKIRKIRLTLDEKIIYKRIINKNISELSTFDNYNIVELKYNFDQSSDFVSKNFPFERIRFSKYCRGIEFTKLNYCNEL